MNAKDVILANLDLSDRIIEAYIGDLDDADLLVRPVAGMNHIAWQLGHLIGAERHFVELIKPGVCPPLPYDFQEGHGREKVKEDDPSKYYSRSKYQELWKAQRTATRSAINAIDESDLNRTDAERFPAFAPTVGNLLSLCGTHALMHAGQFVAVRRQLGKPVTI
jgi:uncharacterized damage-inducible protein DinB